ncbi:hypothetical protein ACIQVE_25195 [Pseudomonas sp. NPDC098747]|uniref:hypothetical protein n=1 Tax=Pseudomonas sp. NPDC098747 TaxID=3364487 RepID=UPI00383BB58C
MEIKVRCARCGGTNVRLPEKLKENSIVACQSCGGRGKYGALKAQALTEAEGLFMGKLGELYKH